MCESPAYAATRATAGGAGMGLLSILPWVAVLLIFYLLMIRPQQQRMKQHRDMIGGVKPRDTAVTNGGLIGKVTKVEDGKSEVEVEIAPNVKVRVVRSTISQVISKTEPVPAA